MSATSGVSATSGEIREAPAHWSGDVVLSDGGAAHVRPIRPSDAPLLAAFHARLSPESIYLRFFSPHPSLSPQELRHFTEVDHEARVALVVLLGDALIGVGRYDRVPGTDEAEVAFIVDDAQHGRGIATLLLERLASAAQERGIDRFVADVLPHNRAMLGVFHSAGFDVESRFEDGVVRVRFGIARSPEAAAAAIEREHRAAAHSIERLLAPGGVAVIAEGEEGAVAETLLRALHEGGFAGPVRRVPAFAPAGDTAGLDLALVAVPPDLLPAQLERCAEWGARAAVVLATDAPADDAPSARGDRALAARARRDGLRLLGPGSLGLARLAGPTRLDALAATSAVRPGRIGLFVESPRRAREVLAAAGARGLGFSTVITAGRKADVSASDALHFFEDDPETASVALVIRNFGNPRRSAAIARRVAQRKPVVVWLVDPPADPPDGVLAALGRHTGVSMVGSLEELLARVAAPARGRRRSAARARPVSPVGPCAGDRCGAREKVDAFLAASQEGGTPPADLVRSLLACYGVAAEEGETAALGTLRVTQAPAWGSFVALDAAKPGPLHALPLDAEVHHAMLEAAPPSARGALGDVLDRIATLGFDVPELAGLVVDVVGEGRARVRSARLAPWTLGLAFSELGG